MKLAVRQSAGASGRVGPRFLAVGDGKRIVHLLRHERTTGTIAQLVASRSGEGTSTLARDLALVAGHSPGLRTLLLDLASPGNGQISALRDEFDMSIAGTRPLVSTPAEVLVHQMDFGDLHVSETFRPPAGGMSGWIAQFPALRANYDLVLIDSPAMERSYDGITLAPDVDTSLLVVEAEKTRAFRARLLRDSISELGGSIGGIVLNKRRFHVPGFIYRRI